MIDFICWLAYNIHQQDKVLSVLEVVARFWNNQATVHSLAEGKSDENFHTNRNYPCVDYLTKI